MSNLHWFNNEHRTLPYVREPYNDFESVVKWQEQGYDNKHVTGEMYDMRNPCPAWFDISYYERELEWKHLSWSFYKMTTGTILPEHIDTFKRFKELYPEYPVTSIRRAIVFLEDWKPGHVLTIGNRQVPMWGAGDYEMFKYDKPHLAANVGLEDRYTLQLTGFDIENTKL